MMKIYGSEWLATSLLMQELRVWLKESEMLLQEGKEPAVMITDAYIGQCRQALSSNMWKITRTDTSANFKRRLLHKLIITTSLLLHLETFGALSATEYTFHKHRLGNYMSLLPNQTCNLLRTKVTTRNEVLDELRRIINSWNNFYYSRAGVAQAV
jgi:hypothetical protein